MKALTLIVTAIAAILALTSCAVTYTKQTGWVMPEPNSPEGVYAAPNEYCFTTIHGIIVYAQPGVICPHPRDVERETEFMLDLTEASYTTFSDTSLVFTNGKFLVGTKWAIGWCSYSRMIVDVSGSWPKTLRHELEHRRRFVLHELGREPADLKEDGVRDWLEGHSPSWWWGVIERGAP